MMNLGCDTLFRRTSASTQFLAWWKGGQVAGGIVKFQTLERCRGLASVLSLEGPLAGVRGLTQAGGRCTVESQALVSREMGTVVSQLINSRVSATFWIKHLSYAPRATHIYCSIEKAPFSTPQTSYLDRAVLDIHVCCCRSTRLVVKS